LWVNWMDVFKISLIYGAVGLLHYIFRKPLLDVSFGRRTEKTMAWDLLFYALFGVIITSAVSVAGVLQVFSYLIVPSVLSTFFIRNVRSRLLFGWFLGFALSLLGMVLSYKLDFPTGPFIVVLFAAMPVLLLIISAIFSLKPRSDKP